ncbi:hypothetical protein ACV34M_31130, partial [Pseudomonas aeruginosa]
HALAGELLDAGTRVIDLSADFRLADAEEWARWYGQPHGAPALLDEAVYGLPEVNREKIRQAEVSGQIDDPGPGVQQFASQRVRHAARRG